MSWFAKQLEVHGTHIPMAHLKVQNYWLQCIRLWYPERHSRSYFLPPLHFNRVPYTVTTVANKQVLVPMSAQEVSQRPGTDGGTRQDFQVKNTLQPVYDSDARADRALQHVLFGLHALADSSQPQEVMMVVSQLKFGKYLRRSSYAAVCDFFPRPDSLPPICRDGDFDVIIIHRQHGLMTLEVKSVGENFDRLLMTEQVENDVVMRKVMEAVNQLNKAELVLMHLVSDVLGKSAKVRKSIALPNISSRQFQRAVCASTGGQDLCDSLGVQSVDEAVKLCLLSDQLPSSNTMEFVAPSVLKGLHEWWQLLCASRTQPPMQPAHYELLLARFCGPATTLNVPCVTSSHLELKTLGEAVSQTGERTASLVLFPQQVDLLNVSPPRVFVTGPPGTGKTVVLTLQGLSWLQRGHDVHVISTCSESRAAAMVIEHQLQQAVGSESTASARVHRHQYDLYKDGESETAIKSLKSMSQGRQLCVLTDEIVHDDRGDFAHFCERLIEQVPGVRLWCASVRSDIRPSCLEEVKLTVPLRSPPVVVREVNEALEIKRYKEVYEYTANGVPVPTDGPAVRRITHHSGRLGHTGDRPCDCIECGHQIARVLAELNVGLQGCGAPPLQYRDVLVLCVGYPREERVDSSGRVSSQASGIVQGLRDCHVPVRVVEKSDEAALRDTALGVSDLVTVTSWRDVRGLERKVVVVENYGVKNIDRIHAISRCSSQLVVFDFKSSNDSDNDSSSSSDGSGDNGESNYNT